MMLPGHSSIDRNVAYASLVTARKACRTCKGLENPSNWQIYDSNQIGPWSLWQGNLNSDLIVVGQDWGDTRYFTTNLGFDKAANPTNRTLVKLLKHIGFAIDPPSAQNAGEGTVFFTNAVLCLKTGGLQSSVDPNWFSNCGPRFLRPTIELIAPKAVVTMGNRAYEAVTTTFNIQKLELRQAVETDSGFSLGPGTRLFPMYHCGARVLNKDRRMEQQLRDWERVRQALA